MSEGTERALKRDVREWHLKEGLPCLSFGDGPPLVVFPGGGMTNANPAGLQRRVEVRLLTPLAGAFTVYRVGRRIATRYEKLAASYLALVTIACILEWL